MQKPETDTEEFIPDPSIEVISNPGGRFLLNLWSEKCVGDNLPSRSDFHPTEMRHQLPYIMLVDLPEDPAQASVRLVGTGIVEATGREMTGGRLSEVRGAATLLERVKWIVENKRPYLTRNVPLFWVHRDYISYDGLGLPLAADGVTVNMLIVFIMLNHRF